MVSGIRPLRYRQLRQLQLHLRQNGGHHNKFSLKSQLADKRFFEVVSRSYPRKHTVLEFKIVSKMKPSIHRYCELTRLGGKILYVVSQLDYS